MTVREAKTIAQEWFSHQFDLTPGLHSVFSAGSSLAMADDAVLPTNTDVDAFFVVDDKDLELSTQQRVVYKGLQLEASYHPKSDFGNATSVLTDFRYAFNLSRPNTVLFDPSGELSSIQRTVAAEYADPKWVVARCERIPSLATAHWTSLMAHESSYARVWGFFMTLNHIHQIPIIALLKPPTFRRALSIFRDLCDAHSRNDIYESYLDLLGATEFTEEHVRQLLSHCSDAFDYAITVRETSYPVDWNVTETARWYMIHTPRDLVARGYFRDATAWILMAWNVAAKAIENDAPVKEKTEHLAIYREFLEEIHLSRLDDCQAKLSQSKALMSDILSFALTLIDGNQVVD